MDPVTQYQRAARIGALERSIVQTWQRIAEQTAQQGRIDRLLREVSELEHRVERLRAA